MGTATKNLEDDHIQILRLVLVMEQATLKPGPKAEHLEMITGIIRNFADGTHHAKEEKFLFPALVQKGYPAEQGPVAVMLHEHEQGRRFVRDMTESISRYKAGDTTALEQVYANMLGYAALLRSHIVKENNVLFRIADQVLSAQEQQSLLLQFDSIENNSEESIRNYLAQMENLEMIFKWE